MSSRILSVFGPALLLVATACTVTARLYPVQGPLSALRPPPVLLARITPNGPTSPATLRVELPDGELCRSPAPGGEGTAEVRGVAAAGDPMQREWDAVFGNGYYVARVVGNEHTRMEALGDRGTRLVLDFFAYGQFSTGVASDSLGNLYKVVFQP
jgi:hypothetical protein